MLAGYGLGLLVQAPPAHRVVQDKRGPVWTSRADTTGRDTPVSPV